MSALPQSPAALLDILVRLRAEVMAEAARTFAGWRPGIDRRAFLPSAGNFAQYLALRRRDLRDLQTALMPWGVSSLGRCEGRVAPNLEAAAGALAALAGRSLPPGLRMPGAFRWFRGDRRLLANTAGLFGGQAAERRGRAVRILVTLPTEAATDPGLLERLVAAGTDAVRINCAHDGPEAWAAMLANLRAAEAKTGPTRPKATPPVRVLMDLAGPKVRTGSILTPTGDPRLEVGETLLLVRRGFPVRGDFPNQACCTIPEILDRVAPGDRVYYDDGKVAARVEALTPHGPLLRITAAEPEGRRLRPEKGLNFPDTDLGLGALTAEDRQALDFVAAHADMIGYSFVQSAADIRILQDELAARRPADWRRLGIIAKIETPKAVRNLPEIIVAAAGRQPFGIMIARGDLAVELGFERTAEMQEEILWLAEAAHVPVIWATQVLESLVKKGLPTRGEMTDAAMAARAECVMLNKGPHVVEAVAALDRLLSRMAEHQAKKTPKLRALRSW